MIILKLMFVYSQQEALKYIHLFCTKNSNGDYCLRLLDNVENGILQPPTNDITVSI